MSQLTLKPGTGMHLLWKNKCPVIDTWWQTETGGHLILLFLVYQSLSQAVQLIPILELKHIVDDNGNILEGECGGKLCILDSWPVK